MNVSHELVRLALKRLEMTRKNARFCARPRHLQQRTIDFVLERDTLVAKGRTFVSIDETSFGRNHPCVKGYAPRGQPLYLQRRDHKAHIKTTSVVACVSRDNLIATSRRTGAYNTASFTAFLASMDLPAATVVLLDNVAFHHSRSVRSLAEEKGWHLLFVPPYSPWFNPIEGCFSIVKRAYYKGCDIDGALGTLTQSHCTAFFEKAFRLKGGPIG